jgi:exodeoxyribonuclease VII small subunit
MQADDIQRTDDIQTLSYEKAFAELEEIVFGLESNQKSLEEALALYERGQVLARHCASLLDQADLRVRQLSALENVPEDMEDNPPRSFSDEPPF